MPAGRELMLTTLKSFVEPKSCNRHVPEPEEPEFEDAGQGRGRESFSLVPVKSKGEEKPTAEWMCLLQCCTHVGDVLSFLSLQLRWDHTPLGVAL